jgi:hypothetical protein
MLPCTCSNAKSARFGVCAVGVHELTVRTNITASYSRCHVADPVADPVHGSATHAEKLPVWPFKRRTPRPARAPHRRENKLDKRERIRRAGWEPFTTAG